MRIKLFFLLLLPVLVFGENCKFKQGDQYVYEMKYHYSEDHTICYRLTYDVVLINEDGSALVSCSHQGDTTSWVVSDEYKVLIGSDKKISMESPFWSLGDTQWESRVKKQTQFYLFTYEFFDEKEVSEFAMEYKWSDEFQAKIFYFSHDKERSCCCSSYTESQEILASPTDGMTLSHKCWEKGKLLFEFTRVQDQSA